MNSKELLEKVSKLGYPLFEPDEKLDTNSVLAEVVKSKDLRLWEGFPLLLANACKVGQFDYKLVRKALVSAKEAARLEDLTGLSLALYKESKLKTAWLKVLERTLFGEEEDRAKKFLDSFKNNKVKVSGFFLDTQRLKDIFNNYFRAEDLKMENLACRQEEFNLEYSLAQVFSPRQKELFLKKLRGEKLSKTEREYFSRVVKKKVLALANSKLHHLAKSLVGL